MYEDSSSGDWEWSDGTEIDYGFDSDELPMTGTRPWESGQPDSSNYLCVLMFRSSTFLWTDVNCANSNYVGFAICSGTTNEPTTDPTTNPTGVPSTAPSLSYDMFLGPNSVSFPEAESYCNSHNQSLVSIHSDAQYAEVMQLCATIDFENLEWGEGCWFVAKVPSNDV